MHRGQAQCSSRATAGVTSAHEKLSDTSGSAPPATHLRPTEQPRIGDVGDLRSSKSSRIVNFLAHRFVLAIVLLASSGLFLGVWTGSNTALAADVRPNIVYVLVDDLGFADLSERYTPKIFALMKSKGTTLNFYTHQNCTPSRVALMTGKDPSRFDLHNVDLLPPFDGVPSSEKLLPGYLREAGYETFMVGKWHIGVYPGQRPNDKGFDEFLGFLFGNITSFGNEVTASGIYAGHAHNYGHDMQYNGVPFISSSYATNLYAKTFGHFVAKATQPFFAYVAFNVPHGPYSAPRKYVDDVRGDFGLQDAEYAKYTMEIGDVLRLDESDVSLTAAQKDKMNLVLYYASVRAMDDSVYEMYEALEKNGKAGNTLFVFSSDNGAPAYLEVGGSNAPLRGGKGSVFEGGHRVANFIVWPGKIAPAANVTENVWIGDIFATFLAAAGVNLPSDIDGTNMLPALLENKSVLRPNGRRFIVSHINKVRQANGLDQGSIAIHEYKKKYIRFVYFDPKNSNKIVSVAERLYYLRNDPSEVTDLARNPRYAAMLGKMRENYSIYGGDERLKSIKSFGAIRKDPRNYVRTPHFMIDSSVPPTMGDPF